MRTIKPTQCNLNVKDFLEDLKRRNLLLCLEKMHNYSIPMHFDNLEPYNVEATKDNANAEESHDGEDAKHEKPKFTILNRKIKSSESALSFKQELKRKILQRKKSNRQELLDF